MNDSGADRADAQHPWIGLASFTEGDRSFFAGRGDEIEDLLRLVRRDTLTLLYGVSGLGKTSLVQAGLFPALREENILPVPIRLDYLEGALPLSHQILNAITTAAIAARVEAPQPRPDETLWEYFHREENHFWSARNDLVAPFLAFDQFEEFFTLGRETPERTAQANAFIMEFADLVENRPPSALRDDRSRVKEFNFKPTPLKVLLAMREDYLADLDRIRSHFRALGQNRLRLLPMGGKQARQVIALGAPLLAAGVEDRIVQYVAGGAGESDEVTVAPALLSLVLRELNERRLARGPEAKIAPDLLDVEQHKIFEDFYLRTLADFPPGVRLFIEDELLTASGHRNSAALDDALTRPDVTLPILNELVNRRLLAYEDRHHTRRVELTHDVLVPVIKASRDSRLTREALAQAERLRAEQVAQRRKQRVTLVVACALAVALIATIWGGYYFFVQEHKAYFTDFSKRNGFPVGTIPISETDARHHAVSFLLIHKGITRDGWKWHWKPAFRMIAVDARLKPTTNHTVGTYLWKRDSDSGDPEGSQTQARAERLGLQTVCQWEFISNADGEIIYERALDREGFMVFGFIYSPPGSGPADSRLARFVGPDGFPQLQRSSQAEYVLIHYDKDGWEDRVTYRDGKNLPAAGPDGAFGQNMSHNSGGQVTQVLSLDADGKNMIDNAGNCGLVIFYNDKGWMAEVRSLGPDLKPMPVKEGWYSSRNEFDALGRSTRTTYHGANGEPVLHKDGYHGMLEEYDVSGNAIATIYVGLDGKPTLLGTGVAIYRSVYNGQGKVTRMTYHGVNNEPVLHRDGNHAWAVQYDERGNTVATTYLGLDGKPTLIVSGYASMSSSFDARGRKTRQSYHGVNGEPLLHKDGNHAWESEYDERGNEVATTFIGADGKPVVITTGYAIVRRKYDSDGNELEEAYFDAAGKPTLERDSGVHRVVNVFDGRGKVTHKRYWGPSGEPLLHKDGNHGWDGQYDDRGNRIATTYLGLDEKPVLLSAGFATMKSTYDAGGRETRMSLYGVNGEPVLHKDGDHGSESKYDDHGRRSQKTYLGLDGKPILMPDGYAKVNWEYDIHGNSTQVTYDGVKGEPVLYRKSYHGWQSRYDERGNETDTIFIGLDQKPILLAEGYAIMKATFNQHGKATLTSYYGVNGEPVLHKEGYHAWQSKFDERGNELVRTLLGLDDKPVLGSLGFATVKFAYNARGKATTVTFFGNNGEPILHKNGYHGWQSKFDERGNETATTYLGLDGKPALLAIGYVTVKFTYDGRGNIVQQTYHGLNDEPMVLKDGYHGWKATYDERGQQVEKIYIDPDGKPIRGKTE
ncbi:MAG: AAA family ATPase [Verrucomicrobiota bacterium]|nr:AAA family ATPase [Verrucomicrobiota bacterium]